jgi:hypothetical protein
MGIPLPGERNDRKDTHIVTIYGVDEPEEPAADLLRLTCRAGGVLMHTSRKKR